LSIHRSHPQIINRLKRASGHLSKVIGMIEQGKPCPEVAQQLHAVVKALESAKGTYVQDHIEHCIDERLDSEKADVKALLRELKDVSKYL
jgi:hypothetical protein NreA